MEVSGKKLSDQDRTYCQPCSEEGKNITGDAFCTLCKAFLCSICINEHRSFKATKRHTLIDKTNMQTSMTDKIHKEDNNVQCDIHPKEFIKYFCSAHETVNCGHCLAFEHRTCKISLVSEISDSFETSQDYGDIRNSIARLLKDVNDRVSDVESNIEMVLRIGEDEVKTLKDYREKINKYFDEREKSLLEDIEQIQDINKKRLESLKPKYDNIKAKLDEMRCKLIAQKSNSANLFIEAKKVKKQVECLETTLNDISKESIVQQYEFKKDTATEKLLAESCGLGIISKDQTLALAASYGLVKVSKGQTTRNQTVPIDLTSLRFTAAQSIPVRSPTDTKECRLTAMLLLPGDSLLLADHNNSTVKLVDLQTSSIVSQIELQGQPWGMCILPGNRVAVCLYYCESIIILETRGQITKAISIRVDGNCYDIAYYNDHLVVSFSSKKLEKIDMEGNTITKTDTVKGQSLFSCCWNLTLMDCGKTAAIFVSDFSKHTITKLDMDLNFLQTFNDPAMQNPRGLTSVGNQLLISSFGSRKILRLDLSTGKIVQLLGEGDGIQNPYSAVYSRKLNKPYIVSYEFVKNDTNSNVHVYTAHNESDL